MRTDIWIGALLFVIVGVFQPTAAADREASLLRQVPGKTGEWTSIVNETYGYSFQVPPGTRIEIHRLNAAENEEYTRMQNYRPAELKPEGGLRSRQYLLEVHSFPMGPRVQARSWDTCPNLVLDHTIEDQGGALVYRGKPRESSDAGGYVKVLCVEKNGRSFYMQAAESDSKTPILTRIFKSFRVL